MPSSLWAVLLSACPVDHYSLHPISLEPSILGFLKFHMLIPHEKITDPIFFSCPSYFPFLSYAPLINIR